MRFSISVVVGALTIGSAATDAFINAFTESGCTGGENSIGVAAGECVSSPEPPPTKTSPRTESNIPVMDTDSACINKVGEVYDCLGGKVAYVNCFANPAL